MITESMRKLRVAARFVLNLGDRWLHRRTRGLTAERSIVQMPTFGAEPIGEDGIHDTHGIDLSEMRKTDAQEVRRTSRGSTPRNGCVLEGKGGG